ncbi:MAG: glycosyltransferase family 2 protein [Spirochaetes bacterium]|nr:glycosyltransferase family 2 protein [Spirochaetota bacterium]
MTQPLVSVISPCYNGASYLARFLDSLLAQTWTNLELFLISDGSTDATDEIALGYLERFAKRGIHALFLRQPNGGAACAVNKGLKLFRGEFLTWPDSDDILDPDCIEAKVAALTARPECGLVYAQCRMVEEGNLSNIVGHLERKRHGGEEDPLFEDLLLERHTYFAPAGTMARASALLSVIPSRHIFESHGGQNWQLLLPLAYRYPTAYVDRELASYVYRAQSHSRSVGNALAKYDRQETLLTAVLTAMEMVDREHYLALVREKYRVKRLNPDDAPDRLGLF